MATSRTTPTAPFLAKCSSSSPSLLLKPSTIRPCALPPSGGCSRISLIRAAKPQDDQESNINTKNESGINAFIPQEDVSYLVKLGAGSVLGAAAIKYGSVLFPEITRPSIVQGLFMIFAPLIVAVLLLIKQSGAK